MLQEHLESEFALSAGHIFGEFAVAKRWSKRSQAIYSSDS